MAALWLEDRRLRLRDDVPVPEPPPGEALVRVLRAGICNTDLELVRGYYPFTGIPGVIGRVVSSHEPGDASTLPGVLAADRDARDEARRAIAELREEAAQK